MVAANKNLLRLVRRLAIRDELLAMRLRGRLVVPVVVQEATGKKKVGREYLRVIPSYEHR